MRVRGRRRSAGADPAGPAGGRAGAVRRAASLLVAEARRRDRGEQADRTLDVALAVLEDLAAEREQEEGAVEEWDAIRAHVLAGGLVCLVSPPGEPVILHHPEPWR